jgi:penicillin-binding protein 2
MELEQSVERAMRAHAAGAVVVVDVRTGRLLALYSKPDYDPNELSGGSGRDRIREAFNKLYTDPLRPMLDKTTSGAFQPGSTFKPFSALAALEDKILSPTDKERCDGYLSFGRRIFRCSHVHGKVDMRGALAASCNVYFFKLAESVGMDRIARIATEFGLGQKTGIDLPNEVSGVMPSEEWKIRNFKQKWFAGETISVGIGQGAVATTPVQLMRALAGISMDGRMVVPHVADPTDLPPRYLEANHYTDIKNVSIDPNGWNVITDAMSRVVLPEGTAPSAGRGLQGIDLAGKTGSAQTISNATKAKIANKADFKDNGWFVGFAPRRNPDIIVTVLTEGGEHGYLAARLAAQVVKAYVEKQRNRQQPKGHQNVAQADGNGANSTPTKPAATEMNGLWTAPNQDELKSGKFTVVLDDRTKPPTKAAPGMENVPAGQEPTKPRAELEKKPAVESQTVTKTGPSKVVPGSSKPKPPGERGDGATAGERPALPKAPGRER